VGEGDDGVVVESDAFGNDGEGVGGEKRVGERDSGRVRGRLGRCGERVGNGRMVLDPSRNVAVDGGNICADGEETGSVKLAG
jgi:hypothetical protein